MNRNVLSGVDDGVWISIWNSMRRGIIYYCQECVCILFITAQQRLQSLEGNPLQIDTN
jgi:hypothetical protein